MSPFVLYTSQTQLASGSGPGTGAAGKPDTVPDSVFVLPGTGFVTLPDTCGTARGWEVCAADPSHHKAKSPRTCGKPTCPKCWSTWAKREAHRQSAVLLAYQNRNGGQLTLFDGFSETGYTPRHDVLSPPLSVVRTLIAKTYRILEKNGEPVSRFDYYFVDFFRAEIKKMLELSGLSGASCVIHPYRIRDEYKDRISAEVRAGRAKDRYDWIRKHPDWYNYVYFSPHVHLVAFGYNIDDFCEKSEGWILTTIREVYDAPGLMFYLLSHTGITEGRNSVSRWGCLSKHNMKKLDEWNEFEDTYCEKCGSVLEYADCDEEGNVIRMTGKVVQRRTRCYLYEIRMPGRPPRQVKVKSSPIETKRLHHKADPPPAAAPYTVPAGLPVERVKVRDNLSHIRKYMNERRGPLPAP